MTHKGRHLTADFVLSLKHIELIPLLYFCKVLDAGLLLLTETPFFI